MTWRATIEAVWRMESARLIAALARRVRDVGLAEELAQDALVAAVEQWPTEGIPDNPGAWLMATAKHRAIDQLRRRSVVERKHGQVEYELSLLDDSSAADEDIEDDLLRLMFTACHPVLSSEAQVALTLRLVGGLTTEEIAGAFLVPEATMAQRIVRAKRALSDAHVPFEIPGGAELSERLASVLQVIYLVFNEGYAATAGEAWVRPGLCEDALRLGRILAELAPREPEAHGLVALMEIQASRLRTRTDAAGAPVLLLDQDRARWDRLLINRGLAALQRAARLNGARPPAFAQFAIAPGGYVLQAEIAACHARALTAEATDWGRIAALYGALGVLMPSVVVEVNRAVAVGFAQGPAAGLAIVDGLSVRGYHLWHAVRGDLLEKLGRVSEAADEFERAAGLTGNVRVRQILRGRVRRMFYDVSVRGIDGAADLLGELRGKVVLAVNVASRCGLTPQYTGLEALQRELKDQDFSVVGFPCNQFGGQEPGTEAEIVQFCQTKYDVSFPMSAKLDVNGVSRHPVYQFLVGDGADIEWNFEKFLIGRDGKVLKRYPPATKPQDSGLMGDIADAL